MYLVLVALLLLLQEAIIFVELFLYLIFVFFFSFHKDESSEYENTEVDEESLIKCYFNNGFEYEEILGHLARFGIHISKSTLLRRLKSYGLSLRRGCISRVLHENVRKRIQDIIDGPGSNGGYPTVWHTLRIAGFQIPRNDVQSLLKELDLNGVELRQGRKLLRRRQYCNSGPNYAWHIDGYDKLKPFGFPIHGCIDGFSRKILWLRVSKSNKSPDRIASMYLNAENGSCPMELETDLGTEN